MTFAKRIFAVAVLALMSIGVANAQFKSEAFSQSYNDDKAADPDSVDTLFSFEEFFGGINHTDPDARLGIMFAGSTVFVGAQQMHNSDYWKLPLIYGGLASTLGAGIWCDAKGHSEYSKYFYIGAGLIYWGTLLDGAINFDAEYPHPGRATVYSILCPGLGQIYNHEAWKLPIYWGGMIGGVHFYLSNKRNYNRFRTIYNAANETTYDGPIMAETALYYRDIYRRYRDYSVLTIAGVYLLQIIDANVFAFMHDFDISDDLALDLSPTVIVPDNQFAFAAPTAFGMSLGFRF